MIDARHGQRVRVVGDADGELDDTCGDMSRRYFVGTVVARIVDDHGATPRDPLLVLRFDDGGTDAFWSTEVAEP